MYDAVCNDTRGLIRANVSSINEVWNVEVVLHGHRQRWNFPYNLGLYHPCISSSSTYMWSRWPSTEFATEIDKIHLPALKKRVVQSLLFSDVSVFFQILSAMRFDILRFPYQIWPHFFSFEVWGSHNSVAQDASFVGWCSLLLGKWVLILLVMPDYEELSECQETLTQTLLYQKNWTSGLLMFLRGTAYHCLFVLQVSELRYLLT
jgi:hypothetical protein